MLSSEFSVFVCLVVNSIGHAAHGMMSCGGLIFNMKTILRDRNAVSESSTTQLTANLAEQRTRAVR